MVSGVSFASAPGRHAGVRDRHRDRPTGCAQRRRGRSLRCRAWRLLTPEDASGANLLACNIAADRYIVGAQLPMLDSYVDIEARLVRDGETVSAAPATEALGGPGPALEWMLSEARVRGLQITDGMLLITGAIGGIHPAKPGSYRADYGALGSVEFTVT